MRFYGLRLFFLLCGFHVFGASDVLKVRVGSAIIKEYAKGYEKILLMGQMEFVNSWLQKKVPNSYKRGLALIIKFGNKEIGKGTMKPVAVDNTKLVNWEVMIPIDKVSEDEFKAIVNEKKFQVYLVDFEPNVLIYSK